MGASINFIRSAGWKGPAKLLFIRWAIFSSQHKPAIGILSYYYYSIGRVQAVCTLVLSISRRVGSEVISLHELISLDVWPITSLCKAQLAQHEVGIFIYYFLHKMRARVWSLIVVMGDRFEFNEHTFRSIGRFFVFLKMNELITLGTREYILTQLKHVPWRPIDASIGNFQFCFHSFDTNSMFDAVH